MVHKVLNMRRRIPYFRRADSHKKVRLMGLGWRKSKGHHGRVKRLGVYRGASPKVGYGTPAKTRHHHSSGLAVIEVASIKELDHIDTKTQGIKLLKVGMRNKLNLIRKALEKKIRIFNVRTPEEFIKQHERVAKKPEHVHEAHATHTPEKKKEEVKK